MPTAGKVKAEGLPADGSAATTNTAGEEAAASTRQTNTGLTSTVVN